VRVLKETLHFVKQYQHDVFAAGGVAATAAGRIAVEGTVATAASLLPV
jgi:hypothetical protein